MLVRYGKEQGKLIKKAIVYTGKEHRINASDVDKDAIFITEKLRSNGHEGFIVGGAVRDLLLGKKPKDFDIATDATPARIKRIFRNSRIIGRRFRLVHVYFGQRIFEVSTFRSLKDGHTGNTYGPMEEDVLRRDFTINALFYDPGKQLVVDYVNGMNDVKKRILRPIIPAKLIFKDDPVRMIRAVKYAAAGEFSIPWLLKRRIKKESSLLEEISPSRLTEELSKIIRSPQASQIIERLEAFGLFGFLQKETSLLMKANPDFRRDYLNGFVDLVKNGYSPVDGKPLAALIRNYLEIKTVWNEIQKGSWDDYKSVYFNARRFILPMNPPKVELEQAVRLVFTEHGIDLKKIRALEKERQIAGHKRAAQAKTEEVSKPRQKRKPRNPAAETKKVNLLKPSD